MRSTAVRILINAQQVADPAPGENAEDTEEGHSRLEARDFF
jgi:hypothetical protein